MNSGVGVARIFHWGGEGQSANHMQYGVIINFQKEGLFMGQKYLRMEDQKPEAWLVRKQDVAKEGGLKPKINVFKICV